MKNELLQKVFISDNLDKMIQTRYKWEYKQVSVSKV